MILTLCGENAYYLKQKLNSVTSEFAEKYDSLAIENIDAEEQSLAKIIESLISLPFLSSRKLIVLRNSSKSKEFAENIEKILSEIPDSNDVIFYETKLDKRQKFYKTLLNKTDFQEFKILDQFELAGWLTNEAKRIGASLKSGDAKYLVERVGLDQLNLSNELKKLSLHDLNISRESIDLLTEPTPQSTIFQLLEEAFKGNKKRVMQLYDEQRELKVEPPQIIGLIAWRLNIIAILKSAKDLDFDQATKQAKINPFVARKSESIAKSLTLSELKHQIEGLISIDIASKSKNVDIDDALKLYLLKLGD